MKLHNKVAYLVNTRDFIHPEIQLPHHDFSHLSSLMILTKLLSDSRLKQSTCGALISLGSASLVTSLARLSAKHQAISGTMAEAPLHLE